MTSQVYHADIVSWLLGRQWMTDSGLWPKYHAAFFDPPYFLGTISKRFGKPGAAPAKFGRDGAFQRQSRGFMGQSWDGFESLYHYEDWISSWAEPLLSFMYPGALLVASGGTRTYHRLATGLENAGWEILDCVICWMYGSGFPKSHAISNDFQHERRGWSGKAISNQLMGRQTMHKRLYWRRLEQRWNAYGTALKPSYEPYVIARAPRGSYTYADLALEFSTGAINVDGGRIEAGAEYQNAGFGARYSAVSMPHMGGHQARNWVQERIQNGEPVEVSEASPLGRFPANTLFACDCETEHAEGCPIRVLDEQSGVLTSGTGAIKKASAAGQDSNLVYGKENRLEGEPVPSYGDSGGASRFFYQAKAAQWEREAGLSDFAQVTVNDGRDTPIDNPFQRGETKRRNIHPTVKPIQLCEYIARLLLPPPGDSPRRLLVPFAGVGSEMIGAQLAGWDEIDGVELTADYIPINAARRRWWAQFSTYAQAEQAAKAERTAKTKVADTQELLRSKAVQQVSIFDYLDQQKGDEHAEDL